MNHYTRTIAVIGSAVTFGLAALTTAAIADGDRPARTPRQHDTTYIEPSGNPVRDGTYLGYVRLTGGHDTSVAIDFVSRTGGRVRNSYPELRIDGGALVDVDVFDVVRQPFRVTVDDGTIVAAQSTDEIPESDASRHIPDGLGDLIADAVTLTSPGDGDDGERVDVAKWLAEHPSVAATIADITLMGRNGDRVDIATWIAEHETISDTEWWNLEKRVLRAVLGDVKWP